MRTIFFETRNLKPELKKFSIAEILASATAEVTNYGVPNARLDVEVLLAHTLGLTRAGLYARLRDVISEVDKQRFHQLLQRRQQREPIQYITGVQEFWSLEFHVTPDVLIPRPETELVVETALWLLAQPLVVSSQYPVVSREEGHRAKSKVQDLTPYSLLLTPYSLRAPHSAIRILDVGTGSGCLAIALVKELPEAEVWAIDVSDAALAIAQKNAQSHGVADRVHFLRGDLFVPLHNLNLTFDLIVSNPPYITQNDIPNLQPEVRNWEPHSALDGGQDGLDFYRRLFNEGPHYLRSGGWFIMEIGQDQGTDVMQFAYQCSPLTATTCQFDYEGRERIVLTQKR